MTGKGAVTDMLEATLGDDIAPPSVPGSLRPALSVLGDWQWGTREFSPIDHYFLPNHLTWLLTEWDRRPLYLFCHAGHGFNSYSLNATIAVGEIAIYAQANYGGAFGNREEDTASANSLFRKVDSITASAHADEKARWLVVCSDFRNLFLLVNLAELDRLGQLPEWLSDLYLGQAPNSLDHPFVLQEAREWFRDDESELLAEALSLRGRRRPSHRDHDSVLLSVPGVTDSGTPHRVVAFLFQDEAVHGQADAESALHEEEHRGATLVALPVGSLIPAWMNAPLDLDAFGLANIAVVHEVADDPAATLLGVLRRVAEMPRLAHETLSITGSLTQEELSSPSLRIPSTKAKRPSLLHRGSSIRCKTPSWSSDE